MNVTDVKRELLTIGNVYPSLLGLMKKKLPSGGKVGHLWATLLTDLDAAHLQDVCHEYATLRRELPEQNERLPFAIREEVRRRMDRDAEALRVHEERIEGERRRREYQASRKNDVLPITEHLKKTGT